jgi:hypothetical protein
MRPTFAKRIESSCCPQDYAAEAAAVVLAETLGSVAAPVADRLVDS